MNNLRDASLSAQNSIKSMLMERGPEMGQDKNTSLVRKLSSKPEEEQLQELIQQNPNV